MRDFDEIRLAQERELYLLSGATGQLGLSILRHWPRKECTIMPLPREAFDLSRPDCLAPILEHYARGAQEYKRITLIHAAAYTNVELAEQYPEEVRVINTQAVEVLAKTCARLGIRMIQISTDYVFDGTYDRPYPVDYPCHPISVYGTTKWLAEEAVKREMERGSYSIVRTSWLYSCYIPNNFLMKLVMTVPQKRVWGIVEDQIGAPTSTISLARSLYQLVQKEELPPIVHLTNRGETSWYGFAKAIFERISVGYPIEVSPIRTGDFPTRAQRPLNSRLELTDLDPLHPISTWQEGVDEVFEELYPIWRLAQNLSARYPTLESPFDPCLNLRPTFSNSLPNEEVLYRRALSKLQAYNSFWDLLKVILKD